MKSRIILRLEGGLIQGIKETSKGLETIQIVVHDYDCDCDSVSDEDLSLDNEGNYYYEYKV